MSEAEEGAHEAQKRAPFQCQRSQREIARDKPVAHDDLRTTQQCTRETIDLMTQIERERARLREERRALMSLQKHVGRELRQGEITETGKLQSGQNERLDM